VPKLTPEQISSLQLLQQESQLNSWLCDSYKDVIQMGLACECEDIMTSFDDEKMSELVTNSLGLSLLTLIRYDERFPENEEECRNWVVNMSYKDGMLAIMHDAGEEIVEMVEDFNEGVPPEDDRSRELFRMCILLAIVLANEKAAKIAATEEK
jgi:hypothetical protein